MLPRNAGRSPFLRLLSSDDSETYDYHNIQLAAVLMSVEDMVESPFSISEFLSSPLTLTAVGIIISITFVAWWMFEIWDSIDRKVMIYVRNTTLQASRVDDTNVGLTTSDSVEERNNFIDIKRGELSSPALAEQNHYVECTRCKLNEHHNSVCTSDQNEVGTVPIIIENYFKGIVPESDSKLTMIQSFLNVIMKNHEYFNMFSNASMRYKRSTRFLVAVSNVIAIIFIETLLFAYFFHSNSMLCSMHSGRHKGAAAACGALVDKWDQNESMCEWNIKKFSCESRPMPHTFYFHVRMSLLTFLLSILPQHLMKWVLTTACSKRPFMEFLSLNRFPWLISFFGSAQRGSKRMSLLGKAEHLILKNQLEEGYNKEDKAVNCAEEYLYGDLLTIQEEVKEIKFEAQISRANVLGQAEGVVEVLGFSADGSLACISGWDKLRFGTPEKKLEWRIKKARVQQRWLRMMLQSFGDDEDDMKDQLLIQHFVLEQMSSLGQLALKRHLFKFDRALPTKIHPLKWILSWTILLCSWGFCTIMILKCFIGYEPSVYKSQIIQFFCIFCQDIFINRMLEIVVIDIFVLQALKRQLISISEILMEIVREKLRGMSSNRFRLVQHLSAACRAARCKWANDLPSSRILRNIDDHDAVCCSIGRDSMCILAYVLLAIPSILSKFRFCNVDEIMSRILFPILGNGLLIINWQLIKLSPIALICFYAGVVASFLFYVVFTATMNVELKTVPYLSSFFRSSSKYVRSAARCVSNISAQVEWRNMNLHCNLQAFTGRSHNSAADHVRGSRSSSSHASSSNSSELFDLTPCSLDARSSIHRAIMSSQRNYQKDDNKSDDGNIRSIKINSPSPRAGKQALAWKQLRMASLKSDNAYKAEQIFLNLDKNLSGSLEADEIAEFARLIWRCFQPGTIPTSEEEDETIDLLLNMTGSTGNIKCMSYVVFQRTFSSLIQDMDVFTRHIVDV